MTPRYGVRVCKEQKSCPFQEPINVGFDEHNLSFVFSTIETKSSRLINCETRMTKSTNLT